MANESTTIEVLRRIRGRDGCGGHLDAGTGETLTPFGRSRRPALFGYSGDNKSFVKRRCGKDGFIGGVEVALRRARTRANSSHRIFPGHPD